MRLNTLDQKDLKKSDKFQFNDKYLTHPVFSAMMLTGGTVLVVVEAVAEVVVLFCCWELEEE